MRMEEAAALHDRDTERVKALTDQLHMAQSMLYDSTKDYLDLKYESRARERGWVQEKDQLLRQMDHYREQLDESQGIDPVLGMNFTNITPRYIYDEHVTYIVRVKLIYNVQLQVLRGILHIILPRPDVVMLLQSGNKCAYIKLPFRE